MRPLEIAVIATLIPAILLPLFGRFRGERWPAWFPLIAALFSLLHLLLEGYRWQMVPAYLLVLVLLLRASRYMVGWPSRSEPRFPWYLVAGAAGLLLLLVALALPLIFPVPDLPAVGGPFQVGTVTYHLVDPTRPEIYTENSDDVREIMVQLWYPGVPGPDATRAPYLEAVDIAGPAVASRLELPPFLLDHVGLIETHSYVGAPVASGGPFPFVVFSHGLRGLRAQNTILMETLAGHGYIVASIDHTYGNVLTVFPDGAVAFYDGDMIFADGSSTVDGGARLVDVWGADVRFLLDQASTWNRSAGHPLAGVIGLERIGVLGHSTGGAAALEVCALDGRCGAVVGLDAWVEPVSPPLLVDYPKPVLFLSAPAWLGPENTAIGLDLFADRAGAGYALTISGTEHFDFTDLPLLSPLTPLLGLSGEIGSERALAIINTYTLAFFDQTLKAVPVPLLDGPSHAYPEVTFIEPLF